MTSLLSPPALQKKKDHQSICFPKHFSEEHALSTGNGKMIKERHGIPLFFEKLLFYLRIGRLRFSFCKMLPVQFR